MLLIIYQKEAQKSIPIIFTKDGEIKKAIKYSLYTHTLDIMDIALNAQNERYFHR